LDLQLVVFAQATISGQPRKRSLGLLGMRAAVFGGAVDIAGAPGQGTTIMARMPVLGINHENPDR